MTTDATTDVATQPETAATAAAKPVGAPAAPATTATPPAAIATQAGVPDVAASTSAAPAAAMDSATAVGAPAGAAAPSQAARSAGVTFPVRPATAATTTQATPAVGHASAADAGSIGGALFSLVLVVGLILALGWLAKRMPGLQRGAGNSNLKVVANVALGPRERAVVVDVGGTQLLLGVGQGGVRRLHTLDAPLPVAAAPATPSPFAQILAQHFGRKP